MSGRLSPARVALAYVVFSVLALALFAVPLWHAWRVNVGTLRVFVPEDMQALPDLFHRQGAEAVAAAVRSRSDPTGREVIVFAGPGREVLAGTLRRWPAELPDAPGTYGHVIDRGDGSMMRIVVSRVSLPGDYHLLMGRQSAGLMSLEGYFWYGMGAAMVIVLALGGGLAWQLARRANVARRSEERFRSLTELSNDFLWETDAQHRYTDIELGPAYAGVRNNAAKLGLARWDIACASPGAAAWAAHRAAIAARERFVDFRFSRIEDGEERFYEHSGEPRYDARGKFLGYRGVGRDVTARVRAEEALRESEARKSAMFETALDCVITMDHEGRVVEFNPAAERTFGYRRAEALGKELAELIIPPRLRAQHREGLSRYLKGGPGPVLGKRTEMPAVRADGNEFPVELTVTRIASRGAPLFTAYLRDITERKRIEEALRESEQRYERALLASNAGLWEWDARKDEYYCSPRHLELLGFPTGTTFSGRADFLRRVPFHPEDLERWQQAQMQLFATGGSYLVMDLRVTGGAETRWVRVNALCFRDGAGTVLRWTGSVTDVTEAKRAEEGLRSSEDRYALAMEAAGDGHTDWNLQTGEHYISPRLLQICGYAEGTTFRDRAEWVRRFPFHPEDRPTWERAVAAHFAGRDSHFKMELRIVVRGEVRWTAFHFLSTRDAAGTPIRWTGSIGDITEQKRTEEALRLSESRYAVALEVADEGHWDWNVRTDEIFASAQALRVMGVPLEVEYRTRGDIMARVRYHPHDAPRISEEWRAALAGRQLDHEFEYRVLRGAAGEPRWIRGRWKVFRDAAGVALRVIGIVTDITEAKLSQEALRISEERYALAVAGSDDGIWDVDFIAGRVFASARARELAGLPPGPEMVPMEEFFAGLPLHADDVARRTAALQAHLAGKAPAYDGEFRLRQPDGVYRWRRIHGICVRDANGQPQRMAGSFSDVDDRRRAEDALRASEERYSLAMEASEEGYVDVNVDTDEFVTSERLNEIFGIARGTRFANRADFLSKFRFYGDDAEVYAAAMRSVTAKDGPNRYEFEFRIVRPSGEVRWLWTRGQVTRDAEGRAHRRIGVVADITARKEAEEARRLSEERYALAVAGSNDGIWDWDLLSDRMFVSERAQHIFGLEPGPTVRAREAWHAMIDFHPDDHAAQRRMVEDYLSGERSANDGEWRVRAKDGGYRWIRIRSICLRNAAGAPVRMAGSVSDIDAWKKAQAALRLSEERYALAMGVAEEGHLDWNVQTDEFFASAQAKRVLNLPPDAECRTRDDMMARVPYHPDDAPGFSAAWDTSLAGREAEHEMEFRILRGEEVRWIRRRWKIFRDAGDAPQRVIGVVSDITERRQAVETLRASESRFRALTELSSDAYWAQDENLRFVPTGSKHDLAGYPSDSHVGKTRWELSDATPLSGSWTEHEAVLNARETFRDFEYRRVGPDGAVRYLSISGAPMFDNQGRFRGYQGVGQDITGRKRAEEEVRESEARFRSLVELSSDWYWKQDENLRFVSYVPPEVGSRSGVAAASSLGKARWEFDNVTPLSGSWEEHKALLAARQPFRDFEYVRVDEKGVSHYTVISGVPLFDADGRFAGYHGVGRNVSERRRMEEDLRKSEARFRALTELSSDWYWRQDEGLRFTYVSDQVADTSMYPREWVIGKARWELPGITPLSFSWAEHQAALAARQPFRDLEYGRVARDGSVEYVSISGAPVYDDKGDFRGYQGIGRNITERKRMEEELRASEARFRRMTELSADTYWEQDENFRYTRTGSGTDIAGYETDVNQGKTRWEMCGEVTPLSGSWQEHQAVLAAHQPFRDFEYRRRRPDGTMGYYSASGAPMFDAEDRFRGYQGVARDITEFRRVEEDLRQSESRFRALTELSSDWYWQQDEDLRFTYVSQQLADSTKYPQESVIGKTRWEMPTITPLSSTWAEHQAVLAARQPFRDFEYVGQGGEDRGLQYVSISGAPIFDERGNFKGYQGTGRNITERKRIEEELRSRQEMLELAQTSARVVAFEWRIGADGPYRNRWSPELATMYGVDPQAYDGSFEQWKKLIHPDDWPAVKKAIKHALRTGEVVTEYRVVHGDGSVHWLHARGRMFFDTAGKPARMLGFMHDVTERKRVEEALHQSEERYALAVAGSNEGIFDWDLVSDRVYVSYRAQELFGLPRGELWRPRRDWRHILSFHPDDAPRLHHSIKAHIEGSTPTYDVEFRIVVPDGEVRWFRQRGIALRDASGKAYRVVGSIGDVTEKHKAEEELRSLERQLRQAQRLEAMGTLAGGIAHDFNNILGAILGYGEMASRDVPKNSRLRRDLDSIILAGERGRALVDRVLAFSRSGVADRVPVHVEKVAREALDLLSAKLPPNVTLHAKLHSGSAAVLGDPTQVHQVLMNLATNAIQAMPAGGTLRVHLDALRIDTARVAVIGRLSAADYLALKVTDTGTGIAAEIMERIFDPFFTTKEVGTGTGLGLSLVHGIVSDLGGAIDVASSVGTGTAFTVYLPRSGDAAEASEEEETDMPRGDGQRVLIVDDEEPLVRLATRTLEELGYAPEGFTSSTAALAAFRADPKRFHAVITDERMPGLSGAALIREVRGIHGSIPIVLMSGYVGVAIARRAREAGAEEVLKKPLSARDLAASLARVLHQ